jgi:hypothetical protein
MTIHLPAELARFVEHARIPVYRHHDRSADKLIS